MANKYIIHGATFCGDGTTSAEAASEGAAGAWNTINIFSGTTPPYGALAAGDTVYIRSKDAAGANIVDVVSTVSFGSTAATSANPISWIIDNGAVWSGVDGRITFNYSGSPTIEFRINNLVHSKSLYALRVICTVTENSTLTLVLNGIVNRCYFLGATGTYVARMYVQLGNFSVNSDCYFRTDHLQIGGVANTNTVSATLINPQIETGSAKNGYFYPSYNAHGTIKIIGGRIFGAGATSGSSLVGDLDQGSGTFEFIGFSVPRTMNVVYPSAPRNRMIDVKLIAADGNFGGHYDTYWGWATSRTDNYPPYLAATVPDSLSTKWAWRVYPKSCSATKPMVLPTLKFYAGEPGVKTITQELLVATTLTATVRNLWITVDYVDDATGLQKHISGANYGDASALQASTADWSATTWGMVFFTKHKLSLTTPTSVRKDSPIIVTLVGTLVAASVDDILFVDPDFAVV